MAVVIRYVHSAAISIKRRCGASAPLKRHTIQQVKRQTAVTVSLKV